MIQHLIWDLDNNWWQLGLNIYLTIQIQCLKHMIFNKKQQEKYHELICNICTYNKIVKKPYQYIKQSSYILIMQRQIKKILEIFSLCVFVHVKIGDGSNDLNAILTCALFNPSVVFGSIWQDWVFYCPQIVYLFL